MKDISPAILGASGAIAIELLKKNVKTQEGIRVIGGVLPLLLRDIAQKKFSSNETAVYISSSATYEIAVSQLVKDLLKKYPNIQPKSMSDKEFHAIAYATTYASFDIVTRRIGMFPSRSLKNILIDTALSTGGRYAIDKYL